MAAARAIRETGQALERLGASFVASLPRLPHALSRPRALPCFCPPPTPAGLRALENPVFKEPFSRHRAVMNLFDKCVLCACAQMRACCRWCPGDRAHRPLPPPPPLSRTLPVQAPCGDARCFCCAKRHRNWPRVYRHSVLRVVRRGRARGPEHGHDRARHGRAGPRSNFDGQERGGPRRSGDGYWQ